jgi:hypothetical protein
MPPFPWRPAGLFLLCLVVAACGGATRIAYDNADVAVLAMGNRYLDLEGEQWRHARAAIERFHAWHRRAELSRYAALLQGAAGRVERGVTRDDVEWATASLRARYAVLVDAAVRESAPLLARLDADNVAALEKHFAAEDRKRVCERLSGDSAKRERDRVAAILRRLEDWTGPLAEAQAAPVRRFVQATADDPQHAHEARVRKQHELVRLLRRNIRAANGASPEELRSFLRAWESERGAEQRSYREKFVALILELDRTLSASQRAHAVARLQRYAADFQELARRADAPDGG